MKFVNRTKERSELPYLLKPQNDQIKNVLIIYGDNGIGKSELINKILEQSDIKKYSIIVEGSHKQKTLKEFYHVDLLLNAIEKKSNRMTNFLLGIKPLFINSLKNFITNKTSSIIGFNNLEIANKINLIRNYLESNLDNNFIYFKNAQSIEKESMDLFLNLASEIPTTIFIFEYTLCKDDFICIKNEINSINKECQYYYVQPINFNEIKQLFNLSKISGPKLKEIKDFYEHANGNLIKLFEKYRTLYINNEPEFNYILLDQIQKIILQLIHISPISFSVEEIVQLLNNQSINISNFESSNYNIIINELISNNILEEKPKLSLSKSLYNQIVESYHNNIEGYIAYNFLKEYFNSKNDIISLFKINCLFKENNEIIQLFPKLKIMAIKRKYPEIIISELEKNFLQDEKIDSFNERIIMFIVELCILCDDYEKGKFYLNKIYNKKRIAHNILIAELEAINYRNTKKSIDIIDKIEKYYDDTSRCTFIIILYKMKIFMERKSIKQTTQLINYIDKIEKFKHYPEYSYYLRNKAELSNLKEGNTIYNECISSLINLNDPLYLPSIYIALSMNYAHLGKLKMANEYNNKLIDNQLEGIREYYLLNNRATIKMLNNIFDKTVISDLKNADYLNSNFYDKIVILCNQLVFYTVTRNINNAKNIISELSKISIEDYGYEEIKHIYYQNILYYYKTINNSKKVDKYKHYIYQLLENIEKNSYTYQLASLQINGKTDDNFFFSNFPYRVDFLGYWDFTVNLDDFL